MDESLSYIDHSQLLLVLCPYTLFPSWWCQRADLLQGGSFAGGSFAFERGNTYLATKEQEEASNAALNPWPLYHDKRAALLG